MTTILDEYIGLEMELKKIGTQSDTKEAEEIREKMDDLWYALSDNDREHLIKTRFALLFAEPK